MVALLSVTMTVHVSATSAKPDNSALSDAQKELDELKEQLDAAEDIVDGLKDSQSDVKGKISKLNKSMITISYYSYWHGLFLMETFFSFKAYASVLLV